MPNLTLAKVASKIGNAVRANRGVMVARPGGRTAPMWRDSAPQYKAVYRVRLWKARLKERMEKI